MSDVACVNIYQQPQLMVRSSPADAQLILPLDVCLFLAPTGT